MQLVRELGDTTNQIQSYGDDYIVINQKTYKTSIIVTENQIIPWDCRDSQQFSDNDVAILLGLKPDVILLSTGISSNPIPLSLSAHILAHQVGLEQMTIGAACRTLTVLLAEKRNVVAGFIFA